MQKQSASIILSMILLLLIKIKNLRHLQYRRERSILPAHQSMIISRGCTYIFLCAPVNYNAAYLSQLKSLIDSDCILTDVGSVKTSIHKEVIRLGMEESFIGGHPMAGSEKSGFMNSKAHLIENAYYILTPTAKVAKEKVSAYKEFVTSPEGTPGHS